MNVMRDYDAGELVRRPITREEQLSCRANFESDGKLYLVRCLACGEPPRGRENYMAAAASGTCAWCGWSEGTT